MKKGFASDNNSGIHPEILKAMELANHGHVKGYGDDPFTEKATEIFKEKFGQETVALLMANGFSEPVIRNDLSGKPRMVAARKP